MERASRCNMCGTSSDEWEDDPYAYEAVRHFCPGCMRREIMSEDNDAPLGKGVSIKLMPKAAVARMKYEMERKESEGAMGPRRRRG